MRPETESGDRVDLSRFHEDHRRLPSVRTAGFWANPPTRATSPPTFVNARRPHPHLSLSRRMLPDTVPGDRRAFSISHECPRCLLAFEPGRLILGPFASFAPRFTHGGACDLQKSVKTRRARGEWPNNQAAWVDCQSHRILMKYGETPVVPGLGSRYHSR